MPDLTQRSLHRCFGGTVRFYEHDSREIGGRMRFAVFLPPQAEQGKVPVLMYLAGLTCTEETFMTKGGALGEAARLGLALIAPDTSPRDRRYAGDDASWDFGLGAGFYVDATHEPWRQGYRMYSYVSSELPVLAEREFPVDSTRWGIFGHSMGGHGALVVGLRNPDRFKSLSAFAPIAAPMQSPWGKKAFGNYLGPDQESWRVYDATELVGSGRTTGPILIDQGMSDQFLAEQLKPELLQVACARTQQPLTLRRHAGYDHSYYFIQTFMPDHLAHHARRLQA
ncbi:MAG: S-formylglutathione hydrolase [Alphaproteobacteria bacterium]|jgi:S-formylglutathione hydrolase|nr:S-formylglutathione hydrolase [Alphaproteobacteria bacterium]